MYTSYIITNPSVSFPTAFICVYVNSVLVQVYSFFYVLYKVLRVIRVPSSRDVAAGAT